MKRIALVGDFNEGIVAHRAIPIAPQRAVGDLRAGVAWEWLPSHALGHRVERQLDVYAGLWCVPGSPYNNAPGVIEAIRWARLHGRPFLGTCAGFQHAMLEYAQAVWRIDGLHAETNPDAENPVIAPLVCRLVEVLGGLHFEPGSRLRDIYCRDSASEEYHCNYGFNPLYVDRLKDGPLKIAACDDAGSVRAVELVGHPFFIGTLFQPERAALRDQVPPLVKAFVGAVIAA